MKDIHHNINNYIGGFYVDKTCFRPGHICEVITLNKMYEQRVQQNVL